MSDVYVLLKDMAHVKAGAKYIYDTNREAYRCSDDHLHKAIAGWEYLPKEIVENNINWFVLYEKPEPFVVIKEFKSELFWITRGMVIPFSEKDGKWQIPNDVGHEIILVSGKWLKDNIKYFMKVKDAKIQSAYELLQKEGLIKKNEDGSIRVYGHKGKESKDFESVEERAYVQYPADKKYTIRDMEECWAQARMGNDKTLNIFTEKNDGSSEVIQYYAKFKSFQDYLNSLK